ncbi:potassium channel family protein [Acetobacterium tundrae]|uniref:Ion transport channel n=1 Tax=Acetobacterium tundrae TaxID=132932 RepID=A0ABR6WPQ2_9FIRM|nr:potassium channel family protein [Acetobacterium tundrae]MBC3798319.1 ion transport channel [Acetobacterium tundrae]
MNQIMNELSVNNNLADGNVIIIIYDLFIVFLFIFELFLFYNKDQYVRELTQNGKHKIKPFRRFFVKLTVSNQYQGILTVTGVLLVISLIVVSSHHTILPQELIAVLGSFAAFIVVVIFVQHFFMKLDEFQNNVVSRFVQLIYYLILGHSFVLFANFISPPSLSIGLIGLGVALILCFSVMISAIANPNLLRSSVSKHRKYQVTASILKGMLVLVISELGILYLMVYNCFKINHGFYASSLNRSLDAFDMLYYLIMTFATVGYGDIIPVRVDGMIFSELVAMIIGLVSMFSTACFVGAVVAGAAQMSWSQTEDADKAEKPDPEVNSGNEGILAVIRKKLKNKDI